MFFRKSKPAKTRKTATAPKPASTTPARPRTVDVPGYRGSERREQARRANAGERREAVRWEPGKGDRRQSHGRRSNDSRWRHH